MPAPRFTLDHMLPLQQHIQDDGQPRRLVHSDPMTDLERDCIELGLLDARGFSTTITPAGIALVQAVDACLESALGGPRHALLDGDDTIVQLGTRNTMGAELDRCYTTAEGEVLGSVVAVGPDARIGDVL